MTGVQFRNDLALKKYLPCLTFCPWPAFKKSGFYFNNASFAENTFKLEVRMLSFAFIIGYLLDKDW